MLKRYLSLFMFSALIASLALFAFGCSTTASSSSNPASPPSGTTSVTVGSGGSTTLTANTKTGACSIVLVDQNQNPITSTNNLNINNIQIEVWSSTSTTSQAATVGTLTYNGGTSGSAISYALTLDRSGSMSYDANASLEAAAVAFINGSGSADQGAVINFDSYVHVDQGLTTNKALLEYAATHESSSGGNTALYDSMATGVATCAAGSNTRKAVIAMTDGGENNSTSYTTTTAVINYANTHKVPIYCVGYGVYAGGSDELNLQAIASGTGGLYYYSPKTSDLTALYNKISSALNSAWTIDFASPITFTTGTTYYVKVTITYSGGITNSTTFTVTL